MKKFILIAWLALLPLVPCGAIAQDDAPTPPTVDKAAPAAAEPQQTPAPVKFYFEVDQSDLAAISQALSELPKRVADPLILKLNAQLQAQAQIIGNKDAAEKAKKGKK